MDFGVIFLSHVESYKEAMRAESQGFTHAWFGDSQMVWADVYQCMALCATHTKTIKLGTNVTNPSSRIAPVTAGNFATLNVLAPGRVIMGIGTGNTSRRTLGMPAAKLAELRSHIDVCRGLLSGETVPYQEGERQRMITFLNPDAGFINLKDSIPVYVAGSGPKTLELAGEIGDGVIFLEQLATVCSSIPWSISSVEPNAPANGWKTCISWSSPLYTLPNRARAWPTSSRQSGHW